MDTKKILIIASILLVLSLATLLVYNFFFKTPAEGPATVETSGGALPGGDSGGSPAGSTLPGASGSPSQAPLKIKAISQEAVLAPAIGENGQTVKYFTRSNGHVFESNFTGGSLKDISSVTLANLIKALWAPDKTKVIGIFSDGSKVKKYFYDYTNNQSSLLSEKIGYVAWAPDSKRIAYHFIDSASGQNNISLANPDGTNWKIIFKTRLNDLIVEWPSREKVSIRQSVSGLAQGILYAINTETGNFNKVLSDLYGLSIKWSPKADKILYSATNDRGQNPRLYLTDESGTNLKDLKLSGLADKCVWGNDDRTVFCALPQEMSANAIWPDDYYKGLTILSDDFYKINLETDSKIKILGSSSQAAYDAQDLFLSPKEDYLFFVNKRDGLLYSLKIQ